MAVVGWGGVIGVTRVAPPPVVITVLGTAETPEEAARQAVLAVQIHTALDLRNSK